MEGRQVMCRSAGDQGSGQHAGQSPSRTSRPSERPGYAHLPPRLQPLSDTSDEEEEERRSRTVPLGSGSTQEWVATKLCGSRGGGCAQSYTELPQQGLSGDEGDGGVNLSFGLCSGRSSAASRTVIINNHAEDDGGQVTTFARSSKSPTPIREASGNNRDPPRQQYRTPSVSRGASARPLWMQSPSPLSANSTADRRRAECRETDCGIDDVGDARDGREHNAGAPTGLFLEAFLQLLETSRGSRSRPCVEGALRLSGGGGHWKLVLGGDLSKYTCCAGYMPCSGKCGEKNCPAFCLGLEVCMCFSSSVASTRFLLQDEYNIKNTKCDNCLIGFMFCLSQLACVCRIVAFLTDVDAIDSASDMLTLASDVVYCTVCACLQTQHKVELDQRAAGHRGTMVQPPPEQSMYRSEAPTYPNNSGAAVGQPYPMQAPVVAQPYSAYPQPGGPQAYPGAMAPGGPQGYPGAMVAPGYGVPAAPMAPPQAYPGQPQQQHLFGQHPTY
ncbi:hypothetical protein CBR_g601 [Chara braunii]|uniref:PLAC8 family protein n=1 Tax=Chara braunii TaxID=69332 RepID=A0A388KBT1_CHABU|nr:hypothetical protein CBR_g601 [Chara braunii]|eukprot:GBG67466.1 hypothetical protein CBR_g601 [Chara braunii]